MKPSMLPAIGAGIVMAVLTPYVLRHQPAGWAAGWLFILVATVALMLLVDRLNRPSDRRSDTDA